MREQIADSGAPCRKAKFRAVVDRIEVDENTVRIIRDRATLEQVTALNRPCGQGCSSVGKWRT